MGSTANPVRNRPGETPNTRLNARVNASWDSKPQSNASSTSFRSGSSQSRRAPRTSRRPRTWAMTLRPMRAVNSREKWYGDSPARAAICVERQRLVQVLLDPGHQGDERIGGGRGRAVHGRHDRAAAAARVLTELAAASERERAPRRP